MPIDRAAYDRGSTDDTRNERIIEFLSAHPGQAFLDTEIYEAINGPMKIPEGFAWALLAGFVQAGFSLHLDSMAEKGLLDRRQVETTAGPRTYYTAKGPKPRH